MQNQWIKVRNLIKVPLMVLTIQFIPSALVVHAGELAVVLAQAKGDGAGVTVVVTRNYFWDAAIVALLFAAAIFAICRSSHRH